DAWPDGRRIADGSAGMEYPPNAGGMGCSLHPMEDVADDRPPRRPWRALLPQNPVREQLVDRAVPALQVDPGVDHRCHGGVAAGNDVRERHLERARLRHGYRVLRMQQRVGGSALGRRDGRVNGWIAGREDVLHVIDRNDVDVAQLVADLPDEI